MTMFRDARVRAFVIQIALIAAVVGFFILLTVTTTANLRARGVPIGFDFLQYRAGFTISETVLAYRPADPVWWAVIVGIANTLLISALTIVAASVLGLIVGIGRLSSNPLVSGTCRVWVEIARNTPVLLLLIFLYTAWWQILPPADQAWQLAPGTYLSIRGLVMPRVTIGVAPPLVIFYLLLTIVAVIVARRIARQRRVATGAQPKLASTTLAASALAAGCYLFVADVRPTVEWPSFARTNFSGGIELTPELTSILIGLVIYTTGFLAEIVRAGVLAIDRGQREAGRALGLSEGQILRLIVVPQALRVIVPPTNSQYINVVKNSTLAIAVGYPDFMTVMGTIINRTSHAIEGIVIIVGVFLALNLALSTFMNWYNRRIALVER